MLESRLIAQKFVGATLIKKLDEAGLRCEVLEKRHEALEMRQTTFEEATEKRIHWNEGQIDDVNANLIEVRNTLATVVERQEAQGATLVTVVQNQETMAATLEKQGVILAKVVQRQEKDSTTLATLVRNQEAQATTLATLGQNQEAQAAMLAQILEFVQKP